jgi:hypothetical protein
MLTLGSHMKEKKIKIVEESVTTVSRGVMVAE